MAERKKRSRSRELFPGDDLSWPIDVSPEAQEDDWVLVPNDPALKEEEPASVLLDEPVPDPDYLHFFNELKFMFRL